VVLFAASQFSSVLVPSLPVVEQGGHHCVRANAARCIPRARRQLARVRWVLDQGYRLRVQRQRALEHVQAARRVVQDSVMSPVE
jgi:hypothetical protein